MIINKVHLLFEQSGTFKKVFNDLGYVAYDYDIKDDFNCVDNKIDLFVQINRAYNNKSSIFDDFSKDDLIIAFFPCIRFVPQSLLLFTCNSRTMINQSYDKKLLYDLKLHKELSILYDRFVKLVYVCLNRGLRLIVENPYDTRHYILNYSCVRPTFVDYNRHDRGDFYEKPTMYFFINCEPSNNLILEDYYVDLKKVKTASVVNRSLISPIYASRFVREFIL